MDSVSCSSVTKPVVLYILMINYSYMSRLFFCTHVLHVQELVFSVYRVTGNPNWYSFFRTVACPGVGIVWCLPRYYHTLVPAVVHVQDWVFSVYCVMLYSHSPVHVQDWVFMVHCVMLYSHTPVHVQELVFEKGM